MKLIHCGRHLLTRQILRVMKLTFILLTFAFLQIGAKGVAQNTVTYSGKKVKLETVFKVIEQQTGFSFFYNDADLKKAGLVTVELKNTPLEEALATVLRNQPLSFRMSGKTIFIKEKLSPDATLHAPAVTIFTPPPIDVIGRVTNEDGEPVPGVTVTVKGTKNATSTNAAGEFLLKGVDDDASLVFTSTNMETREVRINGRTELTVNLKTKMSSLDEMKIIAYGTTSERLRTGAVSTVKAEVIDRQPVGNVMLALQGHVPGLDITQGTAVPGARVEFNIRGLNSLNPIANFQGSNEPLVLIDGVPFSTDIILPTGSGINNAYQLNGGISALAALNPSDIERVDILKDADATAIYGSRGANGVILVTTKRGKQGKPKFSIDVNYGIGKISRYLDMLNTSQYLDMRYQAFANDGVNWQSPSIGGTNDLRIWDTTRYTDWQRVLLGGTAKYSRANLSYSGGTQQNSFRFATNYSNEGSIFAEDFTSQIFSGQMMLNHRSVNNRMGVDVSAGYTYSDIEQPNRNQWEMALILPPNAPKLYNDDGSLNWENNTFNNPLGEMERTQEIKSHNLNTNLSFYFKLLKNLTLKADVGFGKVDFDMVNLRPSTSMNPSFALSPLNRNGQYGRNVTTNTSIEPQVEYKTKLGPGKLDVFVGFSVQRRTNENHRIFASGFLSDDMMRNYGTATDITVTPAQSYDYRYNAISGRVGYNIGDRYILSLNGRCDGSSRFGPGKQFGNFGSAGFAWIFSDVPAIKKILPAFFSFGKLRLSYGLTGSDAIGDYQYLSLYSVRPTLGTFNPPYAVLQPDRLDNPDFGWENSRKADVELTIGLFKDRVTASANYYNNRSSNQLIGIPLPRMTGFSNVNGNLQATVQNSGLEVSLNAEVVKSKNFSWASNFNVSTPRNKLIAYPNLETSPFARNFRIGQPINIRRTYDWVGVNPQTGLNVYRTVDGKDTSSLSAGGLGLVQQHAIVNLMPKFYGGWNNNFRYKDWSLSINIRYDYRTRPDGYTGTPGFEGNIPTYVYNGAWRKPGDIALYQKFTQNFNSPAYFGRTFNSTEQFYSDVWYVTVNNLSLSYTLSGSLLQRMRLSSCQFYLNSQNLFTLTNFNGADPATLGTSGMPRLRIVTIGMKVNL